MMAADSILRPTSSVAKPHLVPDDGVRGIAATAEQTPVGRCFRRVDG